MKKWSPGCGCCGTTPCGEVDITSWSDLRAKTTEYPTSTTAQEAAMLGAAQVPDGWFCIGSSALPDPDTWVIRFRFDDWDDFLHPCTIRVLAQIDNATSNVASGVIGDHIFGEFKSIAEADQNDLDNDVQISIGKVDTSVETILDTTWCDSTIFTPANDLSLVLCRARVYEEFNFLGEEDVSGHNSLGNLTSAGANLEEEALLIAGGPKTYSGFIESMTVETGDILVNIDQANATLFVASWRIIREFDPSSDPLLEDLGEGLTETSSLVATASGNVEDDVATLHSLNAGDTITLDDKTDPSKWASWTKTTESALRYYDRIAFYFEIEADTKKDAVEIFGTDVTNAPAGDRWGLEGINFCGDKVTTEDEDDVEADWWAYIETSLSTYTENSDPMVMGNSTVPSRTYENYFEFSGIDPNDINTSETCTLDLELSNTSGTGDEFYLYGWAGARPTQYSDITTPTATAGSRVTVDKTATTAIDVSGIVDDVVSEGATVLAFYIKSKDAVLTADICEGTNRPTLTYTDQSPGANFTFVDGNYQISRHIEEPTCDQCEGDPICPCDGDTEETVWFEGDTDLTLAQQWADFKTDQSLTYLTETSCGTQDWFVTRSDLCGGTIARYQQWITSRDNGGTTVYNRLEVWQEITFNLIRDGLKYRYTASVELGINSQVEDTTVKSCTTIEEKAYPGHNLGVNGIGTEQQFIDLDALDCTNFYIEGEVAGSSQSGFEECNGSSDSPYCGVAFWVQNV